MEIYITDQLMACLAFCCLGVVAGLCYDILRTVRCLLIIGGRRGQGVICFLLDLIFDLVFMLALAIAVVLLAYCYSYGKLRFFCVISFSVSLILYRVTLGRLYRAAVMPILLKLKDLVLRAVFMVVRPVVFIFSMVKAFAFWVFASTLGKLFVMIRIVRIDSKFNDIVERLDSDVIF